MTRSATSSTVDFGGDVEDEVVVDRGDATPFQGEAQRLGVRIAGVEGDDIAECRGRLTGVEQRAGSGGLRDLDAPAVGGT